MMPWHYSMAGRCTAISAYAVSFPFYHTLCAETAFSILVLETVKYARNPPSLTEYSYP